jgi:hypothetical protein
MKKTIPFIALLLCFSITHAQQPPGFTITITNEKAAPVAYATVELFSNNKLLKAALTDTKGTATFQDITAGAYTISISQVGYKSLTTAVYDFPAINKVSISLEVADKTLGSVTVSSKKPFLQHKEGKTIINVDAAISNTGTTVLEVLEKSPGVMVDKNGGISLHGKAGVLVLIDDKPTYLSGSDRNKFLSSMSSSQGEQIVLLTNPPAT